MPRPPLSIALLGPPEVRVAGEPLRVDTRKAIALLAYLAVTARPARRDTLAGLLWPETAPDRARATLRRTLSALRSALGDRWLAVEGDTVALDLGAVELDVARFRDLVAAGGHDALHAAVDLHRGPFMEGFSLRDSAAFDDWLELESGALRRELGDALDALATSYAGRGDLTPAIACAERRLALDPLHEPAHRLVIRLLALAGDRSAALERYRDCVRVLDRELGVRPLPETAELYHAVLEGTLERAPVGEPPTPVGAETTVEPTLVGRAAELAAIGEALQTAGAHGCLVAITGEAGIGKSRLADEALRLAADAGRAVLTVRCYPEESDLPYGVVAEIVRAGLHVAPDAVDGAWWRGEAARLVPALGEPAEAPLDGPAAQVRFFDAIAGLLVDTLDGPAPGVVLVDDVHWADEASLAFLAYIARRLGDRPLVLVVTWRDDEPGSRRAAERMLPRAPRAARSGARPIVLHRLSVEDVGLLVRGAGRSAELAPRLHRETGGLPFFVTEYLAALERGAVEGDWSVPGGVRDLLLTRLAALGELASQVVTAGAVLGRSFDPDTVRETSGRTEEETVAALEELAARGLVVESPDATLEFRHEQARDLSYGAMTLARRRLLHRRAAAALETAGRRTAHDAVIANHLALGGDEAAAALRFRAAGDEARALYANVEALAHYQRALALGHPEVAALHAAIGDIQTLTGDYGAALASYEAAAAHAPAEAIPGIEHRIGLLLLRRGSWESADTRLAAACTGLTGVELAHASADRALAAARAGRADDATRLATDALELAETLGDPRALAQAHNVLGLLARHADDAPRSRDHLERSLAVAVAVGDRVGEVAARNNLALALGATEERAAAIEHVRVALAVCAELGDRHREAALRNNLADLLRADGHDAEAMEALKQAVAIFAEIGDDARAEPELWKLSDW